MTAATLQDSRTVPSLAELRARKPIEPTTLVFMTEAERDALVELAEAYLAVQATDPFRDGAHRGDGHRSSAIMRGRFREHGEATARLALAAKGVAP